MLGRKFGVEKVNRHDAPVYADARVMLPDLLREAPVARAPVRRQDDHATFVFRDPVRRRRDGFQRHVRKQYAKVAPGCRFRRAYVRDQRKTVQPAMRVKVLDFHRVPVPYPLAAQCVVKRRIATGNPVFHKYVPDNAVHERRMDAVSSPMADMDVRPDPEVTSEKALFYLFNTVHSLYLFPSICPARCPVE